VIDKMYHGFLYLMGFATSPSEVGEGGEHITDLLQRQKQRFPKAWWAVAIGSVVLSVLWFLFEIWLLLHCIGIKPFGIPRKKVNNG
jgi:hypothetical protein